MRIRNRALLKAIFALKGNLKSGIKPSPKVFDGIAIAPFRGDAKAAACISADLELSWAFRHHSKEVARDKGAKTRENMPHLLRIFDRFACPITWATVGHLFLDSCTRASGGLAHAEMPRPPRNDLWTGDWYMHDPCTDYKRDPLWYAPDLIQSVLESPIGHEIGTHSFSHIDFAPGCSDPVLVRRELEESATVMQRFGITPRSFVYPFNHMGAHNHLDLLAQFSISAVRHRDRRIRLSYPERTPSGVYKLYESMNLRAPKHYDYLEKVKIFTATAVANRAVFHLWFHPSDDLSLFTSELRHIVQYLDSLRKVGSLWIATMAEIAAYCEARDALRPEVERKKDEITIVWRGSFAREKYGDTELSLLLPRMSPPRMVTMTNSHSFRHLEPGRSYGQTADGRLLINMPTEATSLHIYF